MVVSGKGLPPGFQVATVDDLLAAMDTAPPAETEYPGGEPDAGYSDGAPDRSHWQPLGARGVREVVIVLPVDDAEALLSTIGQLRGAWGDLTQGEVVLRACRQALEDDNQVGQP
jgi:hypothetical protein